jgi:hypothetical protein
MDRTEKYTTVHGVGVRSPEHLAAIEKEWGEGTVQQTIDINMASLKQGSSPDVQKEEEEAQDKDDGLIMQSAALLANMIKLPPEYNKMDAIVQGLSTGGDHESSVLFCLAKEHHEEYEKLARFVCSGVKQ